LLRLIDFHEIIPDPRIPDPDPRFDSRYSRHPLVQAKQQSYQSSLLQVTYLYPFHDPNYIRGLIWQSNYLEMLLASRYVCYDN
jgi:hypothetical protein